MPPEFPATVAASNGVQAISLVKSQGLAAKAKTQAESPHVSSAKY
jgi:hypothetical protein